MPLVKFYANLRRMTGADFPVRSDATPPRPEEISIGATNRLAALNRPAAEQGEHGTTVFTGSFSLHPGDQHAVTLRYRLPENISASPYRLFVRKQAGTLAPPLTVRVQAPGLPRMLPVWCSSCAATRRATSTATSSTSTAGS